MKDSELSLLITASEKFLHEMDIQSFKENLRSMKKSSLVKVFAFFHLFYLQIPNVDDYNEFYLLKKLILL